MIAPTLDSEAMGYLLPERRNDEDPGDPAGLELDLDLKACPVCRRELLPWQATCPQDGAAAVAQRGLPRDDLPAPPSHLLDDD